MNHSKGMFDMWRQAAVQEYSGIAVDQYRNEIYLPAKTHHDSDRLIGFWLKAANDGWGFRWAILLVEEDFFVGHIGFNSLTACSEIAYHMNPKYWGNGIMTEAANTAIDWRREAGTSKIEAFIEPENTDSIALAFRLGMKATDIFSDGAQRYCMLV
ncbi:MAG: GNAT family N-acetyltransferase [Pseudomonadales bacterium]|nr:GNAT family N-acetyltransferase [Pseudomonadales bacterium]